MSPYLIGQPVRLRWWFRPQKGRFTFHRKSLQSPGLCLIWDEWKDKSKLVRTSRIRPDRRV